MSFTIKYPTSTEEYYIDEYDNLSKIYKENYIYFLENDNDRNEINVITNFSKYMVDGLILIAELKDMRHDFVYKENNFVNIECSHDLLNHETDEDRLEVKIYNEEIVIDKFRNILNFQSEDYMENHRNDTSYCSKCDCNMNNCCCVYEIKIIDTISTKNFIGWFYPDIWSEEHEKWLLSLDEETRMNFACDKSWQNWDLVIQLTDINYIWVTDVITPFVSEKQITHIFHTYKLHNCTNEIFVRDLSGNVKRIEYKYDASFMFPV